MVLTADEPALDRPDESTAVTLTDHLVRRSREAGDEVAWTFIDYEMSSEGRAVTHTRVELVRRMRAVAAWLRDRVEPGERVAILAPQGLDYVVGFLGALHAGTVAVPLFSPDLPGHGDRLDGVLRDCSPACVLTDAATLERVEETVRASPNPPRERAAVSEIPSELADGFRDPEIDPDALAYLQYTSGSTRVPAGVCITHRNVVANAHQALEAYVGAERDVVSVSWLPLFHDMGLVLAVAAPAVGGFPAVLMDPVAFLQQPGRWLQLLSANPGAISAAPNFAYDYCVSRVSASDRTWLRLDDVVALVNGSEPVRKSTVDRFNAAFAECGLEPDTHRSSFGLAEATVFVSVTGQHAEPKAVAFNRDKLAHDIAEPVLDPAEPASTLVSCGNPVGQHVAVVDPESGRVQPDNAVAEIWVHGPNIGKGYWGRPAGEPDGTFHASLCDAPADLPATGWMRTGDLGTMHAGELFITGRRKDLVIIDGRNHYPQDIEKTVETNPSVRGHHTAAFTVAAEEMAASGEAARGEASDRLVVVAEWSRKLDPGDRDDVGVTRAVRAEVSARHAVAVDEILLVEPDTVPRTSSGKVARRACHDQYLAANLTEENRG